MLCSTEPAVCQCNPSAAVGVTGLVATLQAAALATPTEDICRWISCQLWPFSSSSSRPSFYLPPPPPSTQQQQQQTQKQDTKTKQNKKHPQQTTATAETQAIRFCSCHHLLAYYLSACRLKLKKKKKCLSWKYAHKLFCMASWNSVLFQPLFVLILQVTSIIINAFLMCWIVLWYMCEWMFALVFFRLCE